MNQERNDDGGAVEKAVEGHRIEIEFDGHYPLCKLLHPETGCTPGEGGETCWLTDWIEAEGTELLRGKVTLPVRWEQEPDRDHPLFHFDLAAIQPFLARPSLRPVDLKQIREWADLLDADYNWIATDLREICDRAEHVDSPQPENSGVREFACENCGGHGRPGENCPECALGNSGGVEEGAIVAGANACAYLLADEPQARLELIAQRVLEAAAPTQPQLSDEDRERLELIATRIGGEFDVEMPPNAEARADMAFLRKLASQQPVEGEAERLRAALEEIVRIYNDDSLSNSEAQDRTDEVARAALDSSQPQQQKDCETCGGSGNRHNYELSDAVVGEGTCPDCNGAGKKPDPLGGRSR